MDKRKGGLFFGPPIFSICPLAIVSFQAFCFAEKIDIRNGPTRPAVHIGAEYKTVFYLLA